MLRTIDRQQEARGANTNQAYQPKQCEYASVKAIMLSLFTEQQRQNQKKFCTKRFWNATNKVGLSTVAMYVAAIADLCSDQRAWGCNSHPHPRDSVVSSLLLTMKRKKHDEAKQEYVDRVAAHYWIGITPLKSSNKVLRST